VELGAGFLQLLPFLLPILKHQILHPNVSSAGHSGRAVYGMKYLCRKNTEIMGSNPTRCMDDCVCCALSCGLTRADPPSKDLLPTVQRITKLENRKAKPQQWVLEP
jgi:hypothetical protein